MLIGRAVKSLLPDDPYLRIGAMHLNLKVVATSLDSNLDLKLA